MQWWGGDNAAALFTTNALPTGRTDPNFTTCTPAVRTMFTTSTTTFNPINATPIASISPVVTAFTTAVFSITTAIPAPGSVAAPPPTTTAF